MLITGEARVHSLDEVRSCVHPSALFVCVLHVWEIFELLMIITKARQLI